MSEVVDFSGCMSQVSVPLRGNGAKGLFNRSRISTDNRVSVPLRGNGAKALKFNRVRPTAQIEQFMVSVPLRGNGAKVYYAA